MHPLLRRQHHRLGTVRAIQAQQALGHHAVQGRDQVIRVQPHVGKAAQHVDGVVGVQGAKHQVAGQRRLHCYLRRLAVAYLTHHHPVRVVAQYGAQAAGKGQALLLIDRHLHHAGQLVLHRVFDGDDLVAPGVDLGNGGVQRGGFAAAGGAGDQQHAVGQAGQAAYGGAGVGVKAQGL